MEGTMGYHRITTAVVGMRINIAYLTIGIAVTIGIDGAVNPYLDLVMYAVRLMPYGFHTQAHGGCRIRQIAKDCFNDAKVLSLTVAAGSGGCVG